MTTNYMTQMKEFHKMFNVPMQSSPSMLSTADFIRRLTLITSEVGELGDAVRKRDIIEIADALGDILYVTFGMGVEMGFDIDRIFKEIHLSNMSKANSDGTITKDAGGKVLKSPSYKPVDLSWVKDAQRDEAMDSFDDDKVDDYCLECFGEYNRLLVKCDRDCQSKQACRTKTIG